MALQNAEGLAEEMYLVEFFRLLGFDATDREVSVFSDIK